MGVGTDVPPYVLLTGSDLEAFGEKYLSPGFIGVFSRDQLQYVKEAAERNASSGQRVSYSVLNTDVSSGPGRHWQALTLAYPRGRPIALFFDSYGANVPQALIDCFEGYEFYEPGWKFQGNPRREEGGVKSALCGFWVAKALLATKAALE